MVRGFRGENIWWRALILTPIMSTSVSSSANPSAPGTAVTFTVKVANSIQGGAPNGATVTLKDGSKTLAIVPLRAGKASFTTSSLAVGTHNITANYSRRRYIQSQQISFVAAGHRRSLGALPNAIEWGTSPDLGWVLLCGELMKTPIPG